MAPPATAPTLHSPCRELRIDRWYRRSTRSPCALTAMSAIESSAPAATRAAASVAYEGATPMRTRLAAIPSVLTGATTTDPKRLTSSPANRPAISAPTP
jgi:hypothetical protein